MKRGFLSSKVNDYQNVQWVTKVELLCFSLKEVL